eukprot:gene26703-4272_t
MAPKRKAITKAEPKVTKKAAKEPAAKPAAAPAGSEKFSIEIEAWATKLQKLVQESVEGAAVSINTEKPRKGCFEVRNGDKSYVSLLDMPRPFTKLKALDIEALAEEIAADLK